MEIPDCSALGNISVINITALPVVPRWEFHQAACVVSISHYSHLSQVHCSSTRSSPPLWIRLASHRRINSLLFFLCVAIIVSNNCVMEPCCCFRNALSVFSLWSYSLLWCPFLTTDSFVKILFRFDDNRTILIKKKNWGGGVFGEGDGSKHFNTSTQNALYHTSKVPVFFPRPRILKNSTLVMWRVK